jgi:hypothetical protein
MILNVGTTLPLLVTKALVVRALSMSPAPLRATHAGRHAVCDVLCQLMAQHGPAPQASWIVLIPVRQIKSISQLYMPTSCML